MVNDNCTAVGRIGSILTESTLPLPALPPFSYLGMIILWVEPTWDVPLPPVLATEAADPAGDDHHE